MSEAPHPRVLLGVVMARVTICFVLECVCVCVCNKMGPPGGHEPELTTFEY